MRMTRNYYEIMGLPKTATSVDIKRKYHDLARQFHPDRATDKELAARLFAQINMAYRTLSDDNKRAMYNGSLEQEEAKRSNLGGQQSFIPSQPQRAAAPPAQRPAPPPSRPAPTTPLGNAAPRPSSATRPTAPTSQDWLKAKLPSSDPQPLVQGSPTGPMGVPKQPQSSLNSSTINAGDNPVVKSLVKQATGHYNKGEREQSLRIVKSALSLAAANFDALKLMGDIYYDQGRRPEALSAYKDAIKVEPEHRALQERIKQLQALVAASPTPTGPTAGKATDKQDKPSLLSRFIGGQRSR